MVSNVGLFLVDEGTVIENGHDRTKRLRRCDDMVDRKTSNPEQVMSLLPLSCISGSFFPLCLVTMVDNITSTLGYPLAGYTPKPKAC